MSSRNIRLVTQFDPDLPTVDADTSQLQQVLLNLITNALDAMPHGGELRIETSVEQPVETPGVKETKAIRAMHLPSDHGSVIVKVRDTGSGIPEEILPKIFDPFFTTKAVGEGTGIGLSVCQQIIKIHGGVIEVSSQTGLGSAFTIKLPVQREMV